MPGLNETATAQGQPALLDAIREGAVQRIRPKAMTVAVIVAGLMPILWRSGTGSEVKEPDRCTHGRRHAHRAFAHYLQPWRLTGSSGAADSLYTITPKQE
jgi:hypothetical protein